MRYLILLPPDDAGTFPTPIEGFSLCSLLRDLAPFKDDHTVISRDSATPLLIITLAKDVS